MLWDGSMDRVVTGWGNLYKVLWGDGSIGNAGTVGMQVVTESQIFGITDKTPNEKTPNDKTPNDKTPNDKTPNDKTSNDKTPNDKMPRDKTPNDKTPNEKTTKCLKIQ